MGSGSRGYDADRIDVWMGQGEEGLKRALLWGKRSVYGTILSEGDSDGTYAPITADSFPSGSLPDKLMKALSAKSSSVAVSAESAAIERKKAVDDYVASFGGVKKGDS